MRMSANVKTADLAITIVVTLLKAAGLGPEADRILDAIEGAKSCIGLIDDIKNEIVSDPNKDLIRSLFKTMEEEVRSIKADLKEQGLGKDEIESTADALIETTRLTVKQLAQDDDALLDAARLPDSFFKILVHRAEPLPDWCDDTIGKLYEQLLKRVSAEFIERAKDFDRFDKVALASLLRDNLSAKKQRNRIERGVQENRAINLETNRVVKEDQATGLETNQLVKELVQRHPYSIPSRLIFGSRPDVVAEDRFIERGEQEQLNSLIADPTRRRTVLIGMRGCGKTQLAAALAKQCEDANWNLVAWINGVSPDSIKSDLVELAKQLGIGTSDQPTQDQIIHRFLSRVKSAEPADRLIIFDNVEDINHLRELIPSGNGLRVIATTTNNTGWEHQDWTTIKVGVFDHGASIDYLLTVTKSDDHDAADALAKRLGDLPLAIAQAAKTACNKNLSLARYLQRLDSRGEELVIRPIPGDEYTDDVATVLWMAVEDAVDSMKNGTQETARRQLGALALLAESGVPTRWLDPTIAQLDDDESPDTQRDTDEDAHDALTEFIHRSIVQQSADGTTTMLHRLQAQVLRESWNDKEREQANESAAKLLGSVDIDKFHRIDTASRRRETLDLIDALRAIGEQTYSHSLLSERSVSTILKHTLPHAHYLGLDYEALSLRATIALICESFGYKHPDTISLRFHFAESCQSAGKIADAITLYQEVLSTSQQVLGPSHQSTLAALNGLSCAYVSAGHLTVAIPMFEQVLSARSKVLGPDHPDTLRTRGNLAVALHNAGDLDNAIALQEQVVSESRRILGPHHTDTFTFAINLADTYHSARRLDDAIQYYEELSTEGSNFLGYNHPITLTALNNLASVYESAEMFDPAIALYEEVVALRTRFIGPNHIDTLTSRSNLAGGYESVGRLDEAIALYEQILQDSQNTLGPKHPETIGTKANLAHAYHIDHRISDALNLYEDALATSTDTLGAEHPETLHVQHSLATVFESAGDLTTALSLYEQVFSERERLLSFEHPDTLTTANDLANAYSSAGRSQEAIDLHERVFRTRVHLLDVDHPDTLTSGTYLAYAYLTSGHVIEAISLYRELLDVAMDALGPEHTLTQTLDNHVTTLMTEMSTQGETPDER